jgi:LmbE family N-acetylglucosaminyl deacetylase
VSNNRVLIIAPHPDDEILGAGGTIARFAEGGAQVTVLTVAAHMPPLYDESVHRQTLDEARKAHAIVGVKDSIFLDIPAVFVRDQPTHELNQKISDVVQQTRPAIVLMPFPDRHIDHRVIFDAAMVVTRPVGAGAEIGLVAAYETLSETHWNAPHIEPNFTPNWVVDITGTLERKLEALACYQSQIMAFPGPRSVEAVRALAVFRGTQAGFAHGEGLQIIRLTAPIERLWGGRVPDPS